jgi:CRP-like cAMP-binding protein
VHVLAILEPGAFFGESSALLGEHRSCSAVAVGPTRVLEVGTDLLEAMTVDRPEVAIRLIRGLAARLNAAEQRLAAAGLDGLSGPLAQYVAGRLGENSETEARFRTSLRELATGSALSMHEAHQALHQLIDRKLLHVVGEELVVPDREALTTAAPRPVERR